jgi:5-methylcytosine-specific restriction endonuclease McrA
VQADELPAEVAEQFLTGEAVASPPSRDRGGSRLGGGETFSFSAAWASSWQVEAARACILGLNEPLAFAPSTMSEALVLNMTYEPLCVVNTRRALSLVLGEKAEMLHSTGRAFHSERLTVPEPSVVRLAHFVRVPYQRRIALNRRAVFVRDGGKCQYCGAAAENIDHVVPKSRGGAHEWENVVAACRRCNARKEDRLPHEAGLRLARQPFQPRERIWILVHGAPVRAEWAPYLGKGHLPDLDGLGGNGNPSAVGVNGTKDANGQLALSQGGIAPLALP